MIEMKKYWLYPAKMFKLLGYLDKRQLAAPEEFELPEKSRNNNKRIKKVLKVGFYLRYRKNCHYILNNLAIRQKSFI